MNRIIVWFSSGAASAVAAKITLNKYPDRIIEIVNINMDADEHIDNVRFRKDVSQWLGREIIEIKSDKYSSIDEVFLRERYIAGVYGAVCTKMMKRRVQDQYIKPGDELVIGYTAEETDRKERLEENNSNSKFLWPLIEKGITKDDCYKILMAEKIELPEMYKLGYGHNNCLGCVKGGAGYWNKIRIDFPEVFKKRAWIEREIGYSINKESYLDELDPKAGRDQKPQNIECGLFCEGYKDLIN